MSFRGDPKKILGIMDIDVGLHPVTFEKEELDVLMSIFDGELDLEPIESYQPQDCSASTKGDTMKMEEDLKDCKVKLSITTSSRFKNISEENLKKIEESRRAKSTQKNTKWGVKIFQDWCSERGENILDFQTIEAEVLNEKLRVFYAEACPKNPEKRENFMTPGQAREYHKNSLKSIRAAINRHLKDLGRDIDITRDGEFRSANNMLDGKLKQNVKEGLSRPITHKPVINNEDLIKISTTTYLHSTINPVILRLRVWYDLAIHFVSRGLEFHSQLTMNSFVFSTDENGLEYVSLSHETKQKNRQGGLESEEAPSDKRMYSTGNLRCPVASLKLLMKKTPSDATHIFNHCDKDAILFPESLSNWFTVKPVKRYQFTRFMADISKHAGCYRSYTAHCLRATGIQALNDAGFELRHILYMTGHRNESSIRSYNRECSTQQKHNLSSVLSSVTAPNDVRVESRIRPAETPSLAPVNAVNMITKRQPHVLPFSSSKNIMSSGFISNSSFNNCVFQFHKS